MLSSPVDLALLSALALLVFGPKRFPEIGKALGQGLGNFKRALTDAQEEVKSAVAQADKPTERIEKSTNTPMSVTEKRFGPQEEEPVSSG